MLLKQSLGTVTSTLWLLLIIKNIVFQSSTINVGVLVLIAIWGVLVAIELMRCFFKLDSDRAVRKQSVMGIMGVVFMLITANIVITIPTIVSTLTESVITQSRDQLLRNSLIDLSSSKFTRRENAAYMIYEQYDVEIPYADSTGYFYVDSLDTMRSISENEYPSGVISLEDSTIEAVISLLLLQISFILSLTISGVVIAKSGNNESVERECS